MLTDDLATLGYLETGAPVARALTRFQRHALRTYRKTAAGEFLEETPVYSGPEDGVAHPATLDEIARWLARGFRLPLGYFKLARIGAWGELREDMAEAWLALMARIQGLGGTIEGPYGDTKRPLMTTISVGASKYSFHIAGRAVDLNQGQRELFRDLRAAGSRDVVAPPVQDCRSDRSARPEVRSGQRRIPQLRESPGITAAGGLLS